MEHPAPPSVTALTVEREVAPLGVEPTRPLLGWQVLGHGRRGVRQVAWQVRAVRDSGDRAARCDPRDGDVPAVWDSGRVEGDDGVDVEWAGDALEQATDYRWTVRVWCADDAGGGTTDEATGDGVEAGQVTAWAEPAGFGTSLDPAQWGADWIGSAAELASRDRLDLDSVTPLRGLDRIWGPAAPGSVVDPQAPVGPAPWGRSAQLRAELDVPGGHAVVATRLAVVGAEYLSVRLNGTVVPHDGSDPGRLLAAVRPGRNVLTVQARSCAHETPGIVARWEVVREGAPALTLATDGRWHARPGVIDDDPADSAASAASTDLADSAPAWCDPDHDVGGWPLAERHGVHGDPPRGREEHTHRPSPYLRRTFTLARPVRRARLRVTALGLYQVRLGGQVVGADRLTPGWTDYRSRVPYQTFDVTELLHEGGNVLGAVLADGWYAGNICWFGTFHYGDRRALLARLDVEHDDGTRTVVTSDPLWRTADGEIRFADLQNGEVIDHRRARPGWDTAVIPPDPDAWVPVVVDHPEHGEVEPAIGPAVRVMAQQSPESLRDCGDGRWIVDFGRNLVGWIGLRVRGRRGDRVVVRHAEALDRGELYVANLRSARCTDDFLLAGGDEEYFEPTFTVHGFRYCELTGIRGRLDAADVVARVAHADMAVTGEFTCSDPRLNRLQGNIVRSLRGNFLSVPTDCPQRDERLGWTGDAQVFTATAAFNHDVRGFFRKWLRDLRDATVDGAVPHVAPDVLTPASPSPQVGAAGWGDVAVITPWELLIAHGDERIVEEMLPLVGEWLDYLGRHSEAGIRPAEGFGDWLAVTPTPLDLVATAFYARVAELATRLARVAGREDLATRWQALHGRVREAFRARFVESGGQVVSGTQTAYVLALHFGLLDAHETRQAAGRLVAAIADRHDHLTTGFLGTPYLLTVLSDHGHLDVAHRLLGQETYPSWLYPVVHGDATTMWERWDSWSDVRGFADPGMTSFNHYAYGAVGEWMYRNLGGLTPLEPGYRRVLVRPRPGGGVTWGRGALTTPFGRLVASWRLGEGPGAALGLHLEVPVGVTAEVVFPAARADLVTEGGRSLELAPGVGATGVRATGVRATGSSPGEVRVEVGAGVYDFVSG